MRTRGDVLQLRTVGGRLGLSRTDPQRGATMLAAAIGIFALGLVAAIGIPQWRSSLQQRRAAAVVADLHEFVRAFEAYVRKHGEWPPPTRAAGEVPAGMESALGARWSQRPVSGLRYLWAPDSLQRGQRHRAAIVLWRDGGSQLPGERRLVEEIDAQLDDGNLLGGKFQIGYADRPFLVIAAP